MAAMTSGVTWGKILWPLGVVAGALAIAAVSLWQGAPGVHSGGIGADPCYRDGIVHCLQEEAVVAVWAPDSDRFPRMLEISGSWPDALIVGDILVGGESVYTTAVAWGSQPGWSGGFYPPSLTLEPAMVTRASGGGLQKQHLFAGFPAIATCDPMSGVLSGTAPPGSTVHIQAFGTKEDVSLTEPSGLVVTDAGKDGAWQSAPIPRGQSIYDLEGALVIASVVELDLDAARIARWCDELPAEEPTPTPTATQTPSVTPTATLEPTATATQTPPPGKPLFEGWNEIEWPGATVSGVEAVIAAVSAHTSPPDAWQSVALYGGAEAGWSQTFATAPLPSFNTLSELLPGGAYWLFVLEEAELGAAPGD
jgi:hypothetical protein